MKMKVVFLACFLLGTATGRRGALTVPTSFEQALQEKIKSSGVVVTNAAPSSVTDNVHFLIASRSQPNLTEVQFSDNLSQKNYNTLLPFIIWIHGYLSNGRVDWVEEAKTKTLLDRDVNFISLDWANWAQLAYPLAAKLTKQVGGYFGSYLSSLSTNQNVDLTKVWCIGHSLGAHVCGFTGKEVQTETAQKFSTIIGMDPAGPLFYDYNSGSPVACSDRLCSSDAISVPVLHTNPGVFGIPVDIGTSDTWLTSCGPIRTYVQSECATQGPILSDICSHSRSHDIIIHLIQNVATIYKCNNLLCDYGTSPSSVISGYNTNTQLLVGRYFASAYGPSNNYAPCS